jgi:hypothetical protein
MSPPPWCGDSDDFDVPDQFDPCQGTDPPDWCWADADPCADMNPPDWCFDDTTGGDWDSCMYQCKEICMSNGGDPIMCDGMCHGNCGGEEDPCEGDNPPDYCGDYTGDEYDDYDDYAMGICSGGDYVGYTCYDDYECGTGGTCVYSTTGTTTTTSSPTTTVYGGGSDSACTICLDSCEGQGNTPTFCEQSYCMCTDGGGTSGGGGGGGGGF